MARRRDGLVDVTAMASRHWTWWQHLLFAVGSVVWLAIVLGSAVACDRVDWS